MLKTCQKHVVKKSSEQTLIYLRIYIFGNEILQNVENYMFYKKVVILNWIKVFLKINKLISKFAHFQICATDL